MTFSSGKALLLCVALTLAGTVDGVKLKPQRAKAGRGMVIASHMMASLRSGHPEIAKVFEQSPLLSLLQTKQDPKDNDPTTKLLLHALRGGIPNIGFGFMDNFIMVMAGNAIDGYLSSKFGLGTMYAAGVGNALSDAVGVVAEDAIDSYAKTALPQSGFNDEEKKEATNDAVKITAQSVGIIIGCLLGMFPLFFMDNKKNATAANATAGNTNRQLALLQSMVPEEAGQAFKEELTKRMAAFLRFVATIPQKPRTREDELLLERIHQIAKDMPLG